MTPPSPTINYITKVGSHQHTCLDKFLFDTTLMNCDLMMIKDKGIHNGFN